MGAAARSFICILFLTTFNTTSHSDQSIRAGVWRDDGGPLSGFTRDILQQVADNNGWQLIYDAAGNSELLEKLAEKQIDLLLNVPYTKDFKDRFLFNDQFLINDWAELYTATNSSLESLVDLGGKRIGVVESGPYTAALRKLLLDFHLDLELIPFATFSESAQAVEMGTVDAAVLSRVFSLNGAARFDIEKLPFEFSPYEVRFAAADDTQRKNLGAIDSFLAQAKQDGSSFYYAAFDKWFPKDRGYHPPAYIFWLLTLFATTLLGFFSGRLFLYRKEQKRTSELVEHAKKLEQENSEHESLRRQLHQLAYYDEITSLPNRLFFTEQLHAALIEEQNIACVALVDLDRFKSFNDTLGHEAGNALLRLVAKRISASLPENVLLARYGGDEFALLVIEEPFRECVDIARGVVSALQDPITELGSELYVTASIGLKRGEATPGAFTTWMSANASLPAWNWKQVCAGLW